MEDDHDKIKYTLGDTDYHHLRDIFECFSGVMSPLQIGRMESFQFHLFLNHHDLYTEEIDRTKINIIFSKNTGNTKNVNFMQFCQVLTDLALINYTWETNHSLAFAHYIRTTILSKQYFKSLEQFEFVLDKVESYLVHELLNQKNEDYEQYFLNNAKDNRREGCSPEQGIDILAINKISIDRGIVPQLISKPDFVRLFKLTQKEFMDHDKKTRNEWLNLEQCKRFMAAVGIYAFSMDENLDKKYPSAKDKAGAAIALLTHPKRH